MLSIHGLHNNRAAIVRVGIIDAARHRDYRQSEEPILKGVKAYSALVDTGATSTMISSRVTADLNLEPVSKAPFHGLSGKVWVLTYLFHVAFFDAAYASSLHNDDGDQHFLDSEKPAIDKIHVYKRPIVGGEIDGDTSFDVLLGMDIITTGCLTINSNGHFSFICQ